MAQLVILFEGRLLLQIFNVVSLLIDPELRNTGLERSEKLAKDLEWFKEQGHAVPVPSNLGVTYSQYLKELSEKNHQAILCHFYNLYFGHTAGGRILGKKVQQYIKYLCCSFREKLYGVRAICGRAKYFQYKINNN